MEKPIVRELAFDLMVQRGLKDSDERRTISNEEMEQRINIWLEFHDFTREAQARRRD